MDQVRALTSRPVPLKTKELIEKLNLCCGDGDITTSELNVESSPPARRLDCAAHSVASIQAVAERWLRQLRKPSCMASTGW